MVIVADDVDSKELGLLVRQPDREKPLKERTVHRWNDSLRAQS